MLGVKSGTADGTNERKSVNEMIGEPSCFFCKSGPTEYKPVPCRCFLTCKKCAMKMATGGKCKICMQYFTNMSHCVATHAPVAQSIENDDEEGVDVEDIIILEKRS